MDSPRLPGLANVTRGQVAMYAGVGLAAAIVFMLVSKALHGLLGWGLVRAEVPRFLATNLVSFGVTLVCTHVFGTVLGMPALAALALTCVFVPALNFVLMACLVFVRRHGGAARG